MWDTLIAKKGKMFFGLIICCGLSNMFLSFFVNKHNNYPLFEIQNRHAQHCKLPDELIEAKDTEETEKMRKAARHAQVQHYL